MLEDVSSVKLELLARLAADDAGKSEVAEAITDARDCAAELGADIVAVAGSSLIPEEEASAACLIANFPERARIFRLGVDASDNTIW